MRKEYINEVAWSKMFTFLRRHPHVYIGDPNKCKNFVEAVYWIMRTGAQWRELPSRYGKWNTVFTRFNDWSKKNVWQDLINYCIEDPDLEYVMMDATIVRAHACASGYKKGQAAQAALGRSKGGFTTKIHALVDALGNVLKVIITPGQKSDATEAKNLIEGISNAAILGDKGYDSDDLRLTIRQQNCDPVIPPRSNRKEVIDYDEFLYQARHLIENFFSKLKHFRRVFSRFDKALRNYSAFVAFAGAILWLR
jgi:transposase